MKQFKKRQDLPTQAAGKAAELGLWPGLWVVATPIGNLGDLSARGVRALEAADRILCEDTRRGERLLEALGISSSHRLERLDAHANPARLREAVQWLLGGENLALVTDAGTPAISDPGAPLVQLAREEGVRVTPVPGPSAVTALLSVAGFGVTEFAFRGFFPRKEGERTREVQALLEVSRKGSGALAYAWAHVWFESPQRIVDTLAAWATLAPHARLCVAKELTKVHERVFAGSALQAAQEVRAHVEEQGALGEWCFAVLMDGKGAGENVLQNPKENSDWVKALHCLLDAPSALSVSEASRRVSQYFGVAKGSVYDEALRISGKKT